MLQVYVGYSLQNLSLDIVENIYRANEVFSQNKNIQIMQKRLDFQHSALTSLKILAYISLLAREQGCILPKQYEQITKLVYDCQFLLGAWIKSDKKYSKWAKKNPDILVDIGKFNLFVKFSRIRIRTEHQTECQDHCQA